MSSSPDDFRDLRRLLALKRHEQPPPGYFSHLSDEIAIKLDRGDLSEHSTWWEWLVARFDARPVLAGAYAFAISGLMILGFKVSQDLQSVRILPELPLAEGPHPLNITPSEMIQSHFANPAGLVTFSTTEPTFVEPALPYTPSSSFSVQRGNFAH